MSEEPGLFESIREKRKRRRSKSSFFALSVLIRLLLILGLGVWLMWALYPRVIANAGRSPAASPPPDPDGTVTFVEPEDLNVR